MKNTTELEFIERFFQKIDGVSDSQFHEPYEKYAIQEMRKFKTIAGTLLNLIGDNQDSCDTEDFKYIAYPLCRTVFEGFGWLYYIFCKNVDQKDSKNNGRDKQFKTKNNKYEEKVHQFKLNYHKFRNEDASYYSEELLSLLPEFRCDEKTVKKMIFSSLFVMGKMDNNLLTYLKDCFGRETDFEERFKKLYTYYRIASFYDHGNDKQVFLEQVFGNAEANFPVIFVKESLFVIACIYYHIFAEIGGEAKLSDSQKLAYSA